MESRAKAKRRALGDRSGVALAFVAILLIIFIGMAALSIDLGMLLAARTEAQRVADAAALSGALSLLETPNDAALARGMAIDYAARNNIRKVSAEVLPGDVDVDLTQNRVRVRVLRTAERGNALANLFARMLGFETSNVTAAAAARVGVSAGVACPLPMAVVDRWWETGAGRLATSGDQFNPGVDIYNEGPLPASPGGPSQPTGYAVADRGMVLNIYQGDPGTAPLPGWFYLLQLNNPGAAAVRNAINGCVEGGPYEYGTSVSVQTGAAVGPVSQGFGDVIARDSTAFWGTGPNAPAGGCVFRPGAVDASGENVCVSSARIRPAFLIAPTDIPPSPGSNHSVTLRNFVGLFVICVGVLQPSQQTCTGSITTPGAGVHVRFIEYRGTGALALGEGTGSLVRTLQLVE